MAADDHSTVRWEFPREGRRLSLALRILTRGSTDRKTPERYEHPSPAIARLFLFTRGGARLEGANRVFLLKPRIVYLLPTNFSFKIRYAKSFLHYWHFHFESGDGVSLTDQIKEPVECRDAAFTQTFTEGTLPGSATNETPKVFALLCRMLASQIEEKSRTQNPGRFDALRTRLAKHFREPLNVGALAAGLQMSREHLSRRFAAECGVTLKDFHLCLRIEEAKKLLSLGSVSAQTVAERLGFSDAAHFGRIFKSKVGYSPQSYARSHRQSVS